MCYNIKRIVLSYLDGKRVNKGKRGGIMRKNGRITLAVLAAGIVLSAAVRFYVISAHTDMTTGFLYHGDELLCNILYYGIIFVTAIASIFTSRIGEAGSVVGSASDVTGGKAVVTGFFDLAAGMLAAYEGITEMRAVSPTLFLTAVDFLFAAVLLVIGFVTLYKRSFTPGLGYAYSLIGVYCVFRGLYAFMNRMVIVTVPEYLVEILGLIFMALYFLVLGRYLSGNETRRTSGAVCFWGTSTAALVLSPALGTIAASLAAPAEISERIVFSSYAAESFRQMRQGIDAYNMVVTPWVNVMLGLMVVFSMFMMFSSPARSSFDE